jgi:hypothetical protein
MELGHVPSGAISHVLIAEGGTKITRIDRRLVAGRNGENGNEVHDGAQRISTRARSPVIEPFCTNSSVLPKLKKLRNKKQPAGAFSGFAAIHLTKT